MQPERQRQRQAQPPHFGAAEPQRIKLCADSGHPGKFAAGKRSEQLSLPKTLYHKLIYYPSSRPV
jgi:hypothetical protein